MTPTGGMTMTEKRYLTLRIPGGRIHAVEMEDEDSDRLPPFYVCGIGLRDRDVPVESEPTCRGCRAKVGGGS